MQFYENSNSSKAVTTAANECIEENILADFLRKNKAEAIEMCLFEYDENVKRINSKSRISRRSERRYETNDTSTSINSEKCSPNEIEQETDLSPETVEKCWKHYMSIHNRFLYLL